jgi:Holliday junction resolvase-like predicted endonuclease
MTTIASSASLSIGEIDIIHNNGPLFEHVTVKLNNKSSLIDFYCNRFRFLMIFYYSLAKHEKNSSSL